MTSPEDAPTVFTLRSAGIVATAEIRNGAFVMLKGSQARAESVPSFEGSYARLRQELLQDGRLQKDPTSDTLVFTTDVPFAGGTAAGAVAVGRNGGTFTQWSRVTPDGDTQSYEEYCKALRSPAGDAQPHNSTSPVGATWKPFFHELAVKLLEYEDRQPDLIQILRDAGINIQHDEGEPLSVLDPFSFFSLVLKHQSDARVAEIFKVIGERLELSQPAPTDLTGVPWSNPMNAWFFAYRSVRRPEDLPTLWALARQTVTGTLDAATFELALGIRKVALPKLTGGLFWLNPEAFLPLNGINVPYLERRGVKGAGKVGTLPEMNRVLTAARQLNPDFASLSHQAWLAAEESKSVAKLNGEAFPFRQFQAEAAQFASDAPRGNMLLDRRYAPLLLSLMEDESSRMQPSRSPYSGKAQLAVKVGLGGSVKGDAALFARALLIPHESYVDFLPLSPGLTLETGLPDGRDDGPREALRDAALLNELLSTLLTVPPGLNDVGFALTGDFPGVDAVRIVPGQEAALQAALETYVAGTGKSRRLWIGVTLHPDQLESESFPDLLELALTYVGAALEVLERIVERSESQGQPVFVDLFPGAAQVGPLTFSPIPGVPVNQILYGPPGTGKTYRVVDEALSVLDPAFLKANAGPGGRPARKARYDELTSEGQVSFVTFHQSFGYEDFIEGIKPVMSGGQLSYALQDGVFLEAVRAAGGDLPRMVGGESDAHVSVQTVRPEAQVWRMYIDKTVPGSPIRDRSLARGELRMGNWGKTPKDLTDLSVEDLSARQLLFRDSVRVGDLVLLATGIDRIGAVGVVTGEYKFDPHSEALFASDYTHVRTVRWLAQGLDLSAQQVTGKQFSPPALQRVADVRPDEILAKVGLTKAPIPAQDLRPHVLIIDEINRGNVAKIFGELITLLEGGKRAGAAEALTATLPLSRRPLSVPQSLYVIGTMNTADRSLSLLDSALRRRFAFRPVWPQPEVLPVLEFEDGTALDLRKFLYAINGRIERLLSREQVIGHAYLLDLPERPVLGDIALALRERILPLLEEYFFEDWGKIREVLGDDKKLGDESLQFIHRQVVGSDIRYTPNPDAYTSAEAFTLVYSQLEDAVFPFTR